MNDRELLELAAKAAGLSIDKSKGNGGPIPNTGFDIAGNAVLDWHNGRTWNPLADDGDALRLAVKLRMFDSGNVPFDLAHAGDLASTRLAIVRAAAEIGRAL